MGGLRARGVAGHRCDGLGRLPASRVNVTGRDVTPSASQPRVPSSGYLGFLRFFLRVWGGVRATAPVMKGRHPRHCDAFWASTVVQGVTASHPEPRSALLGWRTTAPTIPLPGHVRQVRPGVEEVPLARRAAPPTGPRPPGCGDAPRGAAG